MAEYDDYVVKRISAPQLLATRLHRLADLMIVTQMRGVVAPAVARRERRQRQCRAQPRQLVGAIKHSTQRKHSKRRGAVALDIVTTYAALTQRAGKAGLIPGQHAGFIDLQVAAFRHRISIGCASVHARTLNFGIQEIAAVARTAKGILVFAERPAHVFGDPVRRSWIDPGRHGRFWSIGFVAG